MPELRNISLRCSDSDWDSFVGKCQAGQYQQSSGWAAFMRTKGWESVRAVTIRDGQIAGGLQVLTRSIGKFGKAGYLTKGPVLSCDSSELASDLDHGFREVVRLQRLRIVICQPPDTADPASCWQGKPDYMPNRLARVIDATVLIDLDGSTASLLQRMHPTTRKRVRQAEKRGVRVREGNERDIGVFFALMLETCRRQSVAPNPATEAQLRELWRLFHVLGHMRLSFAECEGETVSGQLSIPFGERITLWKTGWTGKYRDRHPNHLLIFESLTWAQAHGYRYADFAGIGRQTAKLLLRGEDIPEAMTGTSDAFKTSFGGRAVLLPESRVYIPNLLLRALYQGFAPLFASRRAMRWARAATHALQGEN